MPGIIDCHVHAAYRARDMRGADGGFREAIADGIIKGPRLLVSVENRTFHA